MLEIHLASNLLVQAIHVCLMWVDTTLLHCLMQVVGLKLMVARRWDELPCSKYHKNTWTIGKLTSYFSNVPVVDVPPTGYGEIYNIFFYDNQYDVTISNFPRCSFVYFVKMLASSSGARGAHVQCKHVHHIL
jgi:hypothetical protein